MTLQPALIAAMEIALEVDLLMRLVEDYRCAGGSQEHHVMKRRLEAALGTALGTKSVPGAQAATFRLSTDKSAAVSNQVHWIPVDENTPRGRKMWLINKPAGSATQGQYSGPGSFFTHWFPLPQFAKDEDET